MALLSLVLNLLIKEKKATVKVIFSPDIVRALVALSHPLAENVQALKQKTTEIYDLIKTFDSFSTDKFGKQVLSFIKSPVKYSFLAKISFDTKDNKITKEIASKFSSLVMNDKEKGGYLNFPYFVTFLEILDEAAFREHVYPEIEFMMKRGLSLVSLIAQTVDSLSFKFKMELVKMLT